MLRFYANLKALQEEVTGSAIPVTIYFPDNTEVSFAVDYGMFQENKYTEKNREKFSDLEKLDFVLITHAHIDHVGRLPFLVKQGYEKKIYMTQVTRALSYIALNESIKIDAIKNNGNPKLMLYHKDDFYQTMKQIEALNLIQNAHFTTKALMSTIKCTILWLLGHLVFHFLFIFGIIILVSKKL